jgi:hypothetical protein
MFIRFESKRCSYVGAFLLFEPIKNEESNGNISFSLLTKFFSVSEQSKNAFLADEVLFFSKMFRDLDKDCELACLLRHKFYLSFGQLCISNNELNVINLTSIIIDTMTNRSCYIEKLSSKSWFLKCSIVGSFKNKIKLLNQIHIKEVTKNL